MLVMTKPGLNGRRRDDFPLPGGRGYSCVPGDLFLRQNFRRCEVPVQFQSQNCTLGTPARYCLLLLLALCPVVTAGDQKELRPGRLSDAQRASLQPGLQLVLQTRDGARDVRSARLAALLVPPDQSASPFLAAGPFHATLRGYLKLRLRGDYRFALRGNGTATLLINDEPVIVAARGELSRAKPVQVTLVKGYNRLEIDYRSPLDGPAQLRLYWSSEEFTWEPLPSRLLMHDGRDAHWIGGQKLRNGRHLYAQQNCAKCHSSAADVASDGVMPELTRDAPLLAGISQRLNPDWIAAWVTGPDTMRNKTTMPSLLGDRDSPGSVEQVRDLLAYLQGLPAVDQVVSAEPMEELVGQGEKMFEDLGCIACHRFTRPTVGDEPFDRVSLYFAGAKYRPSALVAYLSNPHAHYYWSRMPAIPLTADECRALASFILEAAEGEVSLKVHLSPGDARRGEQLFNSIGCANCHSVVAGRLPVGTKRWTIENPGRGCLVRQDSRRAGTPRYALDDVSFAALAEFLRSDGQSLSRTVAAEFSQRQWKAMHCVACHGRDGHSALLPYVLLEDGVQGRGAEPVPDLTWAGEKLRPAWSRQLFAGRLGYRPRPHFRIRMPRLHARGDLISTGLSHEHGFDLEENPRPPHDEELAAIGSELAASSTGLACHRCHAIGDRQATAALEIRSTNLWYVTERLRYDFYHRWLRDPLRIDPQTKMIKFAQDGRRTGLDTHYDGDARQQFEAVWHYLEQLNRDARKKE
ncbi:MAG: hypothetical protein CMJ81_01965 [Planctomycetaceae bacterium]|nr:hypothetical protein [Planctomycetaceae bacterium]